MSKCKTNPMHVLKKMLELQSAYPQHAAALISAVATAPTPCQARQRLLELQNDLLEPENDQRFKHCRVFKFKNAEDIGFKTNSQAIMDQAVHIYASEYDHPGERRAALLDFLEAPKNAPEVTPAQRAVKIFEEASRHDRQAEIVIQLSVDELYKLADRSLYPEIGCQMYLADCTLGFTLADFLEEGGNPPLEDIPVLEYQTPTPGVLAIVALSPNDNSLQAFIDALKKATPENNPEVIALKQRRAELTERMRKVNSSIDALRDAEANEDVIELVLEERNHLKARRKEIKERIAAYFA